MLLRLTTAPRGCISHSSRSSLPQGWQRRHPHLVSRLVSSTHLCQRCCIASTSRYLQPSRRPHITNAASVAEEHTDDVDVARMQFGELQAFLRHGGGHEDLRPCDEQESMFDGTPSRGVSVDPQQRRSSASSVPQLCHRVEAEFGIELDSEMVMHQQLHPREQAMDYWKRRSDGADEAMEDEPEVVEVSAAASRTSVHPATVAASSSSLLALPPLLVEGQARMLHSTSFLATQDALYLSPCTPPAVRLRSDPAAATPPQCVMVLFSANDLRVHDNYSLALAAARAQAAGGLPVVAICVLDYRTFAQPSVVGGFYRQSPQRARFLLDTVQALRRKLETTLHVPLLIRCGRPEEHVPRLAVELGAVDVFQTSQYAPHERRVQARLSQRLERGVWVTRRPYYIGEEEALGSVAEEEEEEWMVSVVEEANTQHPYGPQATPRGWQPSPPPPVVHTVWQSTLLHLDDLPTPLSAMREGERWYHDDVSIGTIRPTKPYDTYTSQLSQLPLPSWLAELLPSAAERESREPPSEIRGRIPTLVELGYGAASEAAFQFEELIATDMSHPTPGEDAALERLNDWLSEGGMTSMLRFGRDRRTNTKLYSTKLARVSPYISLGSLSPRKYYEVLREYTQANLRDGFVQMQFREAVLRLSRRDYWHWMGLRFGDRLFFSYGPNPIETDAIPTWRHDPKIAQRWCSGLTGIPFADAAMRELVGTGFVAKEGRQALAWLLTRGYGQDWRLGAEWMERCSLDYDPFICYGSYAYSCGLIQDDFGETPYGVHYLAHQHDQTGIYIKKWLPQLSKVPPVYIHRPHILTPRMQAMHGVLLGKSYPYPIKLWEGGQHTHSGAELTAYFSNGLGLLPGYGESLRCGTDLLQPEEYNAAVAPTYLRHRAWAACLPSSAFEMDEVTVTEEVFEPRRLSPKQAKGVSIIREVPQQL